MQPKAIRRKKRNAKRLLGQKGQSFDLTPYNGKMPIVIRVVDHALAFQGWSRSARIRMLNAIKDGQGTDVISEVLELVEQGEPENLAEQQTSIA